MALSDIYRRQHDELLTMAGSLSESLNPESLKKDPKNTLMILAQFSAKLNVHLAMEDKALYPKLIASNNEQCQKTARQFQDEMGGIKAVFEAYTAKWSNSNAISSDTDAFIQESKDLIQALAGRIEKENTTLYTLADTL